MRLQFPSPLVLPRTDLRLPFHGRVHVAVMYQMDDQILRGREHVVADRATVRRHAVAVVWIGTRMVRADVFSEDDTLVESPRTDGASVRLLARMDAFVFSEGT